MLPALFIQFLAHPLAWLEPLYLRWTRLPQSSVALGVALDLTRSKPELLLENALLRQQLVILERQVKKPRLTSRDRLSLLLIASRLPSWKPALLILKPDTLLRWHRQGFRLYWRRKSRARPGRPRLSEELVTLIQQMAAENPGWGAERIRGELLKLGLRVAKDTIGTYLHRVRPAPAPTQGWNTFLKNHAKDVWACDFLPVTDLLFRTVYAFFIIELGSRRVVHFGVTRQPTDTWVAQQLREATPYLEAPRFLIRDSDRKFGSQFMSVAKASAIEVLRIPYRAPRANAVCERFLGSVRRECLDHLLIVSDGQLYRVLKEYVAFFNGARPHQGIDQQVPERMGSRGEEKREGKIISFPVCAVRRVITSPVQPGSTRRRCLGYQLT
jgi:putative transposase